MSSSTLPPSAPIALPCIPVHWPDSCRLLPSRYPPVLLFDAVAEPADLAVVFAIESLGNPRLREQLGELSLVPPEQRLCGPGSSPIMAAFTHLNPEGSRFSDGSYGVYYAAATLETAVAEVSHHRALFLARTAEPAIDVDLRCYRVTVQAELHELRAEHQDPRALALLDANSYAASRPFARRLREQGSAGLIYDSVRQPGGQCVALFTPRAALPPARQAEHVTLRWNGQRMADWYLKSGHHVI